MSSQAAPEPIPVPDASIAPLSEISRITGVFVSPKTAFADIAARPRWFVPVILWCLVGLCFVTLLNQRIGFDRIVQQQMDQNPRMQTMPAEQRASAAKTGSTVGRIFGFASAFVAPPLTVLIVGAVLMYMANSMLGTQIRFVQMCAIAAYAFLTSIVAAILTIVVMYLRSPDDFDIRNPLAFNVGAFLNPDSTPKWLMALGTSLDIFSFWTMALLAIGIMVTKRKLSFSSAIVAVAIPWAVLVLLKVGAAAAFG